MTTELRGIKLPIPRFRIGPLSKELLEVRGYKNLQTFFPTLTKLFRLGRWNSGEEEIWLDQQWRIKSIDCSGTSGPCSISIIQNKDLSDSSVPVTIRSAFLKATHLLDPIQWIRGNYSLPKGTGLPWHHKAWQKAWQKLQDPGNHAYIETIASYTLGHLRENDISPHFNIFYGAFCSRADIYRYNLSEEFQSYRYERWFWKGYNKKLFSFHVVDEKQPNEPVPESVMNEILSQLESEFSDGSDGSTESLDDIDVVDNENCSLKSADSMRDISYIKESDSDGSNSDGSNSDDSDEADYVIYAEIPNYPVMLILTEQNEGTMDMLFENSKIVGARIGTNDWETHWSAWLFQVIAGLSCIQTLLGFTHNDLHTNNIVWSTISDEYIYYKTRAGSIFKVPTFGKIFRIIDFGRSIFTINEQMYISDDFKVGADAEGQYEFVPLVQKVKKEVLPNPSFDLCRLAVSIIDGIFPKTPEKKSNGSILSKERGLVIHETESALYNMIWMWMIDDDGRNIYINPDGSERFPTFDLYKHIASSNHKAIPSQQIMNVVFDTFQISESMIPADTKVYSLFC